MTEETKIVKHNITASIEPDEGRVEKVEPVTGLKDLIMASPENIKTIRNERIELDGQIQVTERSFARLQNQVQTEVNAEKTTDDKDKWSSDTKRKAEMTRRISTDEVAQNLQGEIDELKQNAKGMEVELEYRRNTFSAAKTVAKLVTEREE